MSKSAKLPQVVISANTVPELVEGLNGLLADAFAIYLKTKNFHWHVSGPHFREYHLLFDDQAGQILAMTDILAERVRKLGGRTLTSIGAISRHQSLTDNDADTVTPAAMLKELIGDNAAVVAALRNVHEICADHNDFASASLLENFIDETEQRIWFLKQTASA
ncbi:MAG: DNA starvation/stationary phase protection protein [Rhizomicrobium sp.]